MKKVVFNHLGLKMMSLLLAIVLWVLVMNINDPISDREIRNVPIEVLNQKILARQGKIAELKDRSTTSVWIRGKLSVISDIVSEDITVTADLQNLSIVNAVPVEVSLINDIFGIEITRVRVNTATFNLETIEEREMNVMAQYYGELEDGIIKAIAVEPAKIIVKGAKSKLDKMNAVHVLVDVSGRRESFQSSIVPVAVDEDDEVIDNLQFQPKRTVVRVEIE